MSALTIVVIIISIICIYLIFNYLKNKKIKIFLISLFSLAVSLIICILTLYINDYRFKIYFDLWFNRSSQYLDLDTQSRLPLPNPSTIDYRTAEHSFVYFTNRTPEQVYLFYKNTSAITMQNENTISPQIKKYDIYYQGHNFIISLEQSTSPAGCLIMISS